MKQERKVPVYDDRAIRDISEAVYKARLGPNDTASMLAKDADDGTKLRNRASSYDALTRVYLDILNETGLVQRRIKDETA